MDLEVPISIIDCKILMMVFPNAPWHHSCPSGFIQEEKGSMAMWLSACEGAIDSWAELCGDASSQGPPMPPA